MEAHKEEFEGEGALQLPVAPVIPNLTKKFISFLKDFHCLLNQALGRPNTKMSRLSFLISLNSFRNQEMLYSKG